MDSPPHKRKRAIEDSGDEREQKKVHIEDRRLGIDELHLDVGEKYLLCRTRKAPFRSQYSFYLPSVAGVWHAMAYRSASAGAVTIAG